MQVLKQVGDLFGYAAVIEHAFKNSRPRYDEEDRRYILNSVDINCAHFFHTDTLRCAERKSDHNDGDQHYDRRVAQKDDEFVKTAAAMVYIQVKRTGYEQYNR